MIINNLKNKTLKTFSGLIVLLIFVSSSSIFAQYETRWMSAGSYHNWYSAIGSEIEEGLEKRQQFGMRYPALFEYTDIQAWKSLWIGAADFTDEQGTNYPHKVVHVGPRVNGAFEFFAKDIKLKSKLDALPIVSVDGIPSFRRPITIDEVDENMPFDRAIINLTNNQLGLEMERRIYQFSQPYHDNYIINEYIFTNTGNTDDDEEIELPDNTLKDLVFYFTYRLAPSARTRNSIANSTGWGINTMIDARGDGLGDKYGDPADENFRAQYIWHGYFPGFSGPNNADNIGGPLFTPYVPYTSATDTIGRLGAAQFAGILTLHADTSPQDQTDDPNQPSTVSWEGSDENIFSNNDAYNIDKMNDEYRLMTKGLNNDGSYGNEDRHAYKVEPTGYPGWIEPTNDPALGTSGGFSAANGYGPYTLAPGDSIRIVWAEAAASISHEETIKYGRMMKNGEITNKEKNEIVFWGRDSLFQTFRRILDANENDFEIPQPPLPPKTFSVDGGGNNITLSWDVYEDDPKLAGFEIYRAAGRFDSTYYQIPEPGYVFDASARSYEDTDLLRGVDYYYYIVSVGDAADNNGAGLTPPGALKSSRYYTQTYDPSNLKRPGVEDLSQFRIVPNPFVISADATNLRFPEQGDRLAFFDIPGQCTIQIFTELGELIYEIEHTNGTGDEYWNSITSSNQVIVSGIYIAVVTNLNTGEKKIQKFAVIR